MTMVFAMTIPYQITLERVGVVLIEEDGVLYRSNEVTLRDDIQHLQENRAVYTDPNYFENTLQMLQEALQVATGEQQS